MRITTILIMMGYLLKAQLFSGDVSYLYSGEQLFHPGLKVAVDHELFSKTKIKGKKEKEITKSKGYYLFAGTYFHAQNHNHLFLGSNYYFKRTNHKGRARAWHFGLGAGRATFLQPTYSFENGQAKKHPLAGRWTLFPNFEYQLNYPAHFISEKSSIKVSFWNQYQFPYNNRGLWVFGFDLGLTLHKD